MCKTHELCRLEWAQSIRGWVVKRGQQPIASFDGEQADLAEDFLATLNAQESREEELKIATIEAL